jgi:nucleotide-binding universal stress UspA family protein
MKFLIPTDFSENAFHAAAYALILAKEKPGSSVHLIHVIAPALNNPVLIPDIEREAIKSLGKIIRDLSSGCSTCHFSYSIKIGETAVEINKAAEELNTGIIVMGIRGLGKKTRFLFGSNTISLIDKSSRPVLVIPESSSFNAPRKIVFATDYYDSDLDALEHLFPIATAFNSEIIITHIFEEAVEEHLEHGMMQFISGEISKKVQYPHMEYRTYKSEDIPSGIEHFCESSGADLVVLSAHRRDVFQRLFERSVTKEIIYNSKIPLLIFHIQNKQ